MEPVLPVLAWHNDPTLKADAVIRMKQHRADDEFIQGVYLETDPQAAAGYRGCFHGCLTTDALRERGQAVWPGAMGAEEWHRAGEKLWGIPAALGQILDRVFESLNPDQAAEFAVAVTEAIPVGADLSGVATRVAIDVINDPKMGWRVFTVPESPQRDLVDEAVALLQRRLDGNEPTLDEWDTYQDAVRQHIDQCQWTTGDDVVALLEDISGEGWMEDLVGPDAHGVETHAWVAERVILHIATAPVSAQEG